MPSKTAKQARFMRACAHGFEPKGKGVKCPPMSVAEEFMKADMYKKKRKPKRTVLSG